jgi:hypothetical protein
MNPAELGFTLTLAAFLVWLSLFFGRRQLRALRATSAPDGPALDERRYLRAQAYRRLFCSFLMLVFAALLVGSPFLDHAYPTVREEVRQLKATNPEAPLTPEQEYYVRLFSVYWIVALLVLLLLLSLAALDFWATARFGLRQHRQLQADQHALLRQEVARHRRERNGNS